MVTTDVTAPLPKHQVHTLDEAMALDFTILVIVDDKIMKEFGEIAAKRTGPVTRRMLAEAIRIVKGNKFVTELHTDLRLIKTRLVKLQKGNMSDGWMRST
jgi:hypothetical protein